MGIELLGLSSGEGVYFVKEFGALKTVPKECEKLNFEKDESELFSILLKIL